MTISDFYKMCLTMHSKTNIRVYAEECCIYTGEYGKMPYTLAKHEFANVLVNCNMEWEFYI